MQSGKGIHSFTAKEVLNKVLSSGGTTLGINHHTIAEVLNLVLSSSGSVLNVDLSVAAGEYLHFGTQTVAGTWDDGTWRLGIATLGGDFVLELKTSGSWVEKWAREA